MLGHKKKISSVRRTIFCKIPSNFNFFVNPMWNDMNTKKGDLMESNNGHSIILSLDKNAFIVRSNKDPDILSSANNFAVFLSSQRPTFKDLFIICEEIKRCKCSLITFYFRFLARFVRFHRFLRTRKFHSRMSKFILSFVDRNAKIIKSLLQQ